MLWSSIFVKILISFVMIFANLEKACYFSAHDQKLRKINKRKEMEKCSF